MVKKRDKLKLPIHFRIIKRYNITLTPRITLSSLTFHILVDAANANAGNEILQACRLAVHPQGWNLEEANGLPCGRASVSCSETWAGEAL